MLRTIFCILLCSFSAFSQNSWPDPTQPQSYSARRASSYDTTGANADNRQIAVQGSLTLLDVNGPAEISHIWITIGGAEQHHLKSLVLRMYWDGEATPSVETPIGDFFGLGLGEYYRWQSAPLQVSGEKALNSYFKMPFRRHARITVTNQGTEKINAFYFNVDYRKLPSQPAAETLYFHAQFRQATPNAGWTNDWKYNWDAIVNDKKNVDGAGNYVFVEATGKGNFVGVTLSVLQNQDGWWGEGDDMFFIDGETIPSIIGTGSEDYFLGAWDFGDSPFSYQLYGAPVKGEERAGSRSSVYRFHLDSPIPFSKSFKATIEHGHANARSDNFYSVAYWYQTEPHAAFPPLPPLDSRLVKVQPTGGPGNVGQGRK